MKIAQLRVYIPSLFLVFKTVHYHSGHITTDLWWDGMFLEGWWFRTRFLLLCFGFLYPGPQTVLWKWYAYRDRPQSSTLLEKGNYLIPRKRFSNRWHQHPRDYKKYEWSFDPFPLCTCCNEFPFSSDIELCWWSLMAGFFWPAIALPQCALVLHLFSSIFRLSTPPPPGVPASLLGKKNK